MRPSLPLAIIIAFICIVPSSSQRYYYTYEVDPDRQPPATDTASLFDPSQYTFVPPSAIVQTPRSTSPAHTPRAHQYLGDATLREKKKSQRVQAVVRQRPLPPATLPQQYVTASGQSVPAQQQVQQPVYVLGNSGAVQQYQTERQPGTSVIQRSTPPGTSVQYVHQYVVPRQPVQSAYSVGEYPNQYVPATQRRHDTNSAVIRQTPLVTTRVVRRPATSRPSYYAIQNRPSHVETNPTLYKVPSYQPPPTPKSTLTTTHSAYKSFLQSNGHSLSTRPAARRQQTSYASLPRNRNQYQERPVSQSQYQERPVNHLQYQEQPVSHVQYQEPRATQLQYPVQPAGQAQYQEQLVSHVQYQDDPVSQGQYQGQQVQYVDKPSDYYPIQQYSQQDAPQRAVPSQSSSYPRSRPSISSAPAPQQVVYVEKTPPRPTASINDYQTYQRVPEKTAPRPTPLVNDYQSYQRVPEKTAPRPTPLVNDYQSYQRVPQHRPRLQQQAARPTGRPRQRSRPKNVVTLPPPVPLSPPVYRTVPFPTPAPRPQETTTYRSAQLAVGALPPDSDNDGIPGQAGVDYPTLHSVPPTSFSCGKQPLGGYYADLETSCQAVHICQNGGIQDSFLCPNGTIWNQEKFACQWWYEVNCAQSAHFYALNENLYKVPTPRPELQRSSSKKRGK